MRQRMKESQRAKVISRHLKTKAPINKMGINQFQTKIKMKDQRAQNSANEVLKSPKLT